MKTSLKFSKNDNFNMSSSDSSSDEDVDLNLYRKDYESYEHWELRKVRKNSLFTFKCGKKSEVFLGFYQNTLGQVR